MKAIKKCLVPITMGLTVMLAMLFGLAVNINTPKQVEAKELALVEMENIDAKASWSDDAQVHLILDWTCTSSNDFSSSDGINWNAYYSGTYDVITLPNFEREGYVLKWHYEYEGSGKLIEQDDFSGITVQELINVTQYDDTGDGPYLKFYGQWVEDSAATYNLIFDNQNTFDVVLDYVDRDQGFDVVSNLEDRLAWYNIYSDEQFALGYESGYKYSIVAYANGMNAGNTISVAGLDGGTKSYTYSANSLLRIAGTLDTTASTEDTEALTFTVSTSVEDFDLSIYAITESRMNSLGLTTDSLMPPIKVTSGELIPAQLPYVPSKTDYVFGGYYTAANGGGDKWYDSTGARNMSVAYSSSGDTNLYAYWHKLNAYVMPNGGTLSASDKISDYNSTTKLYTYLPDNGDTVGDLPLPTNSHSNATFVGWYKNSSNSLSGLTDNTNDTDVLVDGAYYIAVWKVMLTYNIQTFVMNTSGVYPSTATSAHTSTAEANSSVTFADLSGNYGLEVSGGIQYAYAQFTTNGSTYSNATSGTIAPVGTSYLADDAYTTVCAVKLYYKRMSYTVTLNAGELVESVSNVGNNWTIDATSSNTTITQTLYYEQKMGELPTPIKTGYIFSGWALDNGSVLDSTTKMGTSAIIATAVYGMELKKIIFDDLDTFDIELSYVNNLTTGGVYAKTESALSWYQFKNKQISAGFVNAGTYGVVVYIIGLNDGDTVASSLGNSEFDINTSSILRLAGMVTTAGGESEAISITVSSSTTELEIQIYALTQANMTANDIEIGNMMAPISVARTSTITSGLPSIPTKTDYTFTGYYTSAEGGEKWYNADGSSAGKTYTSTTDTNLYSQWTLTNPVTITFNPSNGENTTSQTIAAGKSVTTPTAPTREGYVFKGWADSRLNSYVNWGTARNAYETQILSYSNISKYLTSGTAYNVSYEINVTGRYNSSYPTLTTEVNGGMIGFVDFSGEKLVVSSAYRGELTNYMKTSQLTASEIYTRDYTLYQYGQTLTMDFAGLTDYAMYVYLAPRSKDASGTYTNYTTTINYFVMYLADDLYLANATYNDYKNEDTTLYAIWEPIKYTVTANLDGGAMPSTYYGWNASSNTVSKQYIYGENLGDLGYTKPGYTFNGWKDTSGNNITSITAITSNITINPQNTVNNVTVDLDAGAGTIPATNGWTVNGSKASKYVTYDSAYGTLPTPERYGYEFTGWAGNLFNVSEFIKFYTTSSVNEPKYSPTIMNDGTLRLSAVCGYNESASSPILYNPTLAKGTYRLSYYGYTNAAEGTLTSCIVPDVFATSLNSMLVTSNTRTLYSCEFTVDDTWTGFRIRYSTNDYVYLDNIRLELISPNTPKVVTDTSIVDEPILHTLVATWKASMVTITADANGGTITSGTNWTISTDKLTATQDCFIGLEIGTLPIATKTGYSLVGWYTEADGGTEVTTATIATVATTIYAKWEINTYILKVYHMMGGLPNDISITASGCNVSTDSSRELTTITHTYSTTPISVQFSTSLSTPRYARISVNTEYSYHLLPCTYSWTPTSNQDMDFDVCNMYGYIIINSDGINSSSISIDGTQQSITSGSTYWSKTGDAIILSTIAKTGYTFKGWYNSATASDANLISSNNPYSFSNAAEQFNGTVTTTTIYAMAPANTYQVKYDANGGSGEMSNSAHTYDVARALNTNAFTRTDYKFAGWSKTPDGEVEYQNGASVKNLTTENNGIVTLYAVWAELSDIEFTIYTYVMNTEGAYVASNTSNLLFQESSTVNVLNNIVPKLNIVVENGILASYIYEGKGTTASSKETLTSSISYTAIEDIELTLYFTRAQHNVILNPNGGTCIEENGWTADGSNYTKAVYYQAQIGTLPVFTKSGYIFNSWLTTDSATLTNTSTMGVADINATAQWNEDLTRYIIFDDQESYEYSLSYTNTAKGFDIATNIEDGKGWYLVKDNQLEVGFDAATNGYGVVVYITGLNNGDTITSSLGNTTFSGSIIRIAGELTGTDPTVSVTVTTTSTEYTIAVYAMTNDVMTSNGLNVSMLMPPIKATKGSAIPSLIPSTPERLGYQFDGYATSSGEKWYNADGTSTGVTYTSNDNVKLYSQWISLDINVTVEVADTRLEELTSSSSTSGTYRVGDELTLAAQGKYSKMALSPTWYISRDDGASWTTANNGNSYTYVLTQEDYEAGTIKFKFVTTYSFAILYKGVQPTYRVNGGTFANINTENYSLSVQCSYASLSSDNTVVTDLAIPNNSVFYGWYIKGIDDADVEILDLMDNNFDTSSWGVLANTSNCTKIDNYYRFTTSIYALITKVDDDVDGLGEPGLYFALVALTLPQYTLTVSGNEGVESVSINNGSESITATYGYSYTLKATINNVYTFKGWYDNAEGTGTALSTDLTYSYRMINNADTTIYAICEVAPDFTLTANANEGTIPTTSGWTGSGNTATKSVKYGREYGTLPTPTRIGYSFTGWFTSATGGTKVSESDIMGSANVTIFAQWTINSYILTASLEGKTTEGGKVSNATFTSWDGWSGGTDNYADAIELTKKITYQETYGTLPEIEAEGYKFIAWYNDLTGGEVVTESSVMGAGDVTIYPRWEQEKILTANANNGTLSATTGWTLSSNNLTATKALFENDAYGILPIVTRDGYTLLGWFTSATGGDEVTAETLMGTSSTTIYAQWKVNAYTIKFNDSNSNESSTEADFGSTITLPTAPTRAGYVFKGWADSAFNDEVISIENPTGNSSVLVDRNIISKYLKINTTYNISYNFRVTGSYNSAHPTAQDINQWGQIIIFADGAPISTNYTNKYCTSMNLADLLSSQYLTSANGMYMYGDSVTTPSVPSDLNSGYIAAWGVLYNEYQPTNTIEYFVMYTDNDLYQAGATYTLSKTSNTTLYAIWEPVNYTVTANANGGTFEDTADWTVSGSNLTNNGYIYQSYLGAVPTPTRYGYEFGGWYTSAEGGTQLTSTSQIISNTTIYANWISKLVEVEVITSTSYAETLAADCSANGTYLLGTTLTLSYTANKNFEVNKFTVARYDRNLDLIEEVDFETKQGSSYSITYTISEDDVECGKLVFKAIAQYSWNKYVVTDFDTDNTNGGYISGIRNNTSGTIEWFTQLDNTSIASEDVTIYAMANKGYEFVGWYLRVQPTYDNFGKEANSYMLARGNEITDSNGTYYSYTFDPTTFNTYDSEMGGGNFYALFLKKSTITIVKDEGVDTASINGIKEQEYVATYGYEYELNAVTKPGYSFKGWYTNAEGVGEALSTNSNYVYTMGNNSVTIYAITEADDYTITLVYNGGIDNKLNHDSTLIDGTFESDIGDFDVEYTAGNYDWSKTSFNGIYSLHIIANSVSNGTQGKLSYNNYGLVIGDDYRLRFKVMAGADSSLTYNVTGVTQLATSTINLSANAWTYIILDFTADGGEYISTNFLLDTGVNYYFDDIEVIRVGEYTPNTSIGYTVTTPQTKLPYAVKDGYVFKGWNTQQDGNGVFVNSYIGSALQDLTYYAIYELSNPTVTITADKDTIKYGEEDSVLTANTNTNGLTVTTTYQWYVGTTKDFAINNTTKISGATAKTYTHTSTLTDVGTYYYRCVVTITKDGKTSNSITSNAQAIEVVQGKTTLTITMEDYQYATTKAEPRVTSNPSGGQVTFYYNTENSSENGRLWTEVTSATYLNVGTYYMCAVVSANGNYTSATSNIVEFKVTEGEMSIAIKTNNNDLLTKIYDGNELQAYINPSVNATIKLGSTEGNYTSTVNGTANTNALVGGIREVGTLAIYYEVSAANYKSITGDIELVIYAKEVEVQWEMNDSYTYNGHDQSSTVKAYYMVGETRIDCTVTFDKTFKNAGTYTATATSSDDNYTLTNYTKEITIARYEITITAEDKMITYGDGEVEYTYKINKTIFDDITVTYVLKSGDTKITLSNTTDAGEYTIVPSSNLSTVNYSIMYVNGTLTVGKYNLANATIEAVGDQQYTGQPHTPKPAVTALGSILVEGTHFEYTYSNNVNAGTATITVTAKDNTNYTGSKSITFNISADTVAIPEATGELVYDGTLKTANIGASDFYTITNNTAVDAGNYNAIVSLTDKINFTWTDGTNTDKSIPWNILKGETSVALSESRIMVRSGDSTTNTATVEYLGDLESSAAITTSGAQSNIEITASGISNKVSVLTITGKESTTTTQTITVTFSGDKNHNPSTATFTVEVPAIIVEVNAPTNGSIVINNYLKKISNTRYEVELNSDISFTATPNSGYGLYSYAINNETTYITNSSDLTKAFTSSSITITEDIITSNEMAISVEFGALANITFTAIGDTGSIGEPTFTSLIDSNEVAYTYVNVSTSTKDGVTTKIDTVITFKDASLKYVVKSNKVGNYNYVINTVTINDNDPITINSTMRQDTLTLSTIAASGSATITIKSTKAFNAMSKDIIDNEDVVATITVQTSDPNASVDDMDGYLVEGTKVDYKVTTKNDKYDFLGMYVNGELKLYNQENATQWEYDDTNGTYTWKGQEYTEEISTAEAIVLERWYTPGETSSSRVITVNVEEGVTAELVNTKVGYKYALTSNIFTTGDTSLYAGTWKVQLPSGAANVSITVITDGVTNTYELGDEFEINSKTTSVVINITK